MEINWKVVEVASTAAEIMLCDQNDQTPKGLWIFQMNIFILIRIYNEFYNFIMNFTFNWDQYF